MRNKFETRRILITSNLSIESACSLIRNLPVDPIRPLEITIGEAKRARSLDANGLMWFRLGEIAEQGWVKGKQFNADTWHEYCKKWILPHEITTKDGEKRTKYIDIPDGTTTIISTTQLEKTCFSEYITLIEAFGAGDLGVHFSANPRNHG